MKIVDNGTVELHRTPNPLMDGTQAKDHGFTDLDQDAVNKYNKEYLQKQEDIKAGRKNRQQTIDNLSMSQGRDADILGGSYETKKGPQGDVFGGPFKDFTGLI